MAFTNSPLVTYTLISPNRTIGRNHAIDTITIHCFVGQVTAKRGCEVFQPTSKGASCNYVVGYDGSIGLCVEEKDRSWCTGGYTTVNGVKTAIKVNGISGSSNDYQAVTIEVACEAKEPYTVTPKAMEALINLVADICQRNGIKKLLWEGNKNLVGNIARQNMTVHRWFAPKSCPGTYLYERMGEIATKVNAKIGAGTTNTPAVSNNTTPAASNGAVPYLVKVSVSNLRIRTNPTTSSLSKGFIAPGVYTIVSEATGQGATLWGKLKSGQGWISLDYATKC
ncbi:MAG: N-acetylmuramoyl-L-alanine amidase [Roseburia sp.]|nr:N-acetylmuramoyl-L-alanine amidase [Roseburia sp.]